ncbi:MAG: hypothetical protein QXS20_02345 [Candidatus Thorarchaeota archaeon]
MVLGANPTPVSMLSLLFSIIVSGVIGFPPLSRMSGSQPSDVNVPDRVPIVVTLLFLTLAPYILAGLAVLDVVLVSG